MGWKVIHKDDGSKEEQKQACHRLPHIWPWYKEWREIQCSRCGKTYRLFFRTGLFFDTTIYKEWEEMPW